MRLSARLATAVALLTVVISLYPLIGWRMPSASLWAFLMAPLPRVITPVDVLGNVLAYVPLGLLLLLAGKERHGVTAAALLAWFACVTLSACLETAQHFLPGRVPSNVDLASNAFGGFIGVLLGVRWRHRVERGGRLQYAWQRLRAEGQAQETGIAVLLIWVLAQWSPNLVPFGAGAVRTMVGLPAAAEFSADAFAAFETAIVAVGLLAAGLPAALMLRRHRRRFAVSVVAAGAAAKSSGMALLGAGSLSWLTPGTWRGLALGGALLALLATLRPGVQRALAMVCVVTVGVLANLLPDNPYHLPFLPPFPAAQWLNLDGLSRLAGACWPLLALAWLWSLRTEN